MKVRGVVAAVGLLVLGLSGCSAKEAPREDGVRTLYLPISDSLTGPGERAGTWSGADQRSTWHATLDGSIVTVIDETVTYTDSAKATRKFTYDSDGRLASAREDRLQVTFGAKATPDTLRVMMDFRWVTDSLVSAEKRLNGEDRLAQPFDVDNLRYHGVELLMAARIGAPLIFPGGK